MKQIKIFSQMIKDGFKEATHGSLYYHVWMGILTFFMLWGAYSYYQQISEGLVVTGMSDRVSWGLYISNFTFLVGVAAAAVMLVLPTYILHDVDFKQAVLIGEGMAVSALVMCITFVMVDVGGPGVLWHMIPGLGTFNFPNSMLTWDMVVLNVYLFINITVPMYILFRHYQGKVAHKKVYLPGVMISVFWAVALHMVTAFLYQGLQARPFWNTALLGPRFLASAFAAGPALIILALGMINQYSSFKIEKKTIQKIALVITVSAQANLIMLGSELFKEFYSPTHHSISAQYLFFGLGEHKALVPWIWTSIGLNLIATAILTFNQLRKNMTLLYVACVILFIAIWIDKGFGLIVPGFIPGQWGKIVEYTPSSVEIGVTVGIWALGCFIFTILTRATIAIELGAIRYKK
ncbi:sulfate reduction electron transfer complex DsrMKJOP subunit DsrP [Flammeovirga kamogawensis]|uniref:Polysulfide reductase NrfD n=1 Tax=Flammeovirga kamogawensis TaxID=373891 RepID=A0ABX8H533_9BACT|nr:NrfD/PsrC family molybdoenzyme membrane anchor subunit [Flammeovirga kamogawensis]MBB6461930.1 molybdopterin-containing oxidoreductase family membrane subunit [Flammeovirga kamogawensis]QWG10462.1 polysulfide reductase NrfD [Flammeovirga kamogawensis]TRX63573.1 polysulfide reductase [Flammeovirga kamogawensis]